MAYIFGLSNLINKAMENFHITIFLRSAIVGQEIIRDICRGFEYAQTSSNSFVFEDEEIFEMIVEEFNRLGIEFLSGTPSFNL